MFLFLHGCNTSVILYEYLPCLIRFISWLEVMLLLACELISYFLNIMLLFKTFLNLQLQKIETETLEQRVSEEAAPSEAMRFLLTTDTDSNVDGEKDDNDSCSSLVGEKVGQEMY